MPRASCADCEWEADALTLRVCAALLERHIAEHHNVVSWEDDRG